jgi:hypothetical protein
MASHNPITSLIKFSPEIFLDIHHIAALMILMGAKISKNNAASVAKEETLTCHPMTQRPSTTETVSGVCSVGRDGRDGRQRHPRRELSHGGSDAEITKIQGMVQAILSVWIHKVSDFQHALY